LSINSPIRFLLLTALIAIGVSFSASAHLKTPHNTTSPAKDGRDFAGFYEEVSATDLSESRYVSLKFKIFNYSDADVSGATIRISDRFMNETKWSLGGVSIEDRQSVVVSGEFAVAQSEYENWQRGGSPHLTVEYQNAQGVKVQRVVELARMFIGEVQ